MESFVGVAALRFAEQESKAAFPRLVREDKRNGFSSGLGRHSCLYVVFEGRTSLQLSVGNDKQLVQTRRMKRADRFGAKVIRNVVAGERIKSELESKKDEKSGRNESEK
jgi:hypothetical protein